MRYRVGIRDLRDSLSRWIEKVKRGHRVEVTDHGRTVAVLSAPKPPRRARNEEEHLARLEAEGLLIRRGTGWRQMEPIPIDGVDLSKAILEDREERL
jgi:prevent-host-death family protein